MESGRAHTDENSGNRGVLLPRCSLCAEVPEQGIKGGIKLKKAFICNQCEEKISHAEMDSDYYEILIEKLKDILK
jgi:hypothetical protein